MTVLSGSQGGLSFKGAEVQCRSWTLNTTQEALETTDLSTLDRTYLYGRIDGTGEATVLYDPEDTGAVEMLNTIFSDDSTEDSITFALSVDDSVAYVKTGFLTSVGTSVSIGAAHACRIRFQLSDTTVTINITGPDRTPIDTTRQYFSAVDGAAAGTVEGYLWTSMGATFDDPTAQNPNVTFNTPGDITLKVTATLQGGQQIEDTLVVTVTQDPIFIAIRPVQPLINGSNNGRVCFDFHNGRNFIYWVYAVDPFDGGPSYIAISKFDRQGQHIYTQRLEYGVNGGNRDALPTTLRVMPTSGDLIMLTTGGSFESFLFRIRGSTGELLAASYGFYGNTVYSVFTNGFWISEDETFIYTSRRRTGWYAIPIENPGNPDFTATGWSWETDDGSYVKDSGSSSPPYFENNVCQNFDSAGNIVTVANNVLWRFAPNFGGDLANGIGFLGAKQYTAGNLDRAPVMINELGFGTLTAASSSNVTTILRIDGATYQQEDYFTSSNQLHLESPSKPAYGASVGVSAVIGREIENAKPGEPVASSANNGNGILFFNPDFRTSPKHVNTFMSNVGVQSSHNSEADTYDPNSGLFGGVYGGFAGDARFKKCLLVADTNAAPGTYQLDVTQSEGSFSSIRANMQVGDNTGYTPVWDPLTTGAVADKAVGFFFRAPDSTYVQNTVWVQSDVTSEHIYEVQVQAP